MNVKLITTILLSMVPTFEGRYAVVTALAMGMPKVNAYLLAVICSLLPVPFIFLLLRPVLDWMYRQPIKLFRAVADFVHRKGERNKRQFVESRSKGVLGKISRYVSRELLELIALFIFVAVPLPGTGVWTGSLIAVILEIPPKKAGISIVLGNIVACLITTLTFTGITAIGG